MPAQLRGRPSLTALVTAAAVTQIGGSFVLAAATAGPEANGPPTLTLHGCADVRQVTPVPP